MDGLRRRLPRLRRRPQIGLLGKFALVSVIPVVALGLALGYYLKSKIHDDAFADAARSAELITRLGIQPQLSRSDLRRGLTPERVRVLDGAVQDAHLGKQLVRIEILNRDAQLVYSDDNRLIGSHRPSRELLGALGGLVTTVAPSGANHGAYADDNLLQVFVPLRFGGTRPEGALKLYLPYQPVSARIERSTEELYAILVGGLLLLYAVLFRIVAAASRTLRSQSDELRRQAEETRHQALHDALTQLPNRRLFHDRVTQALLTARRTNGSVGVMVMDLNRFKEINDTLGHHCGDLLLQEVSERLQGTLRESDSIARLGGDEFALLLPTVADEDAATQVAARVGEALKQPFTLEGLTIDVGGSIGIALSPHHGDDVNVLLQRADVAMYAAKEARSGYKVYSTAYDQYTPDRLALGAELRRAIDEGELVLHYQPKAHLRSGEVRSVEALVRWHHPVHGLIPPNEFIELAEHTGLMKPLTMWVLEAALRQRRAWHDAGLELSVAVNLSARDLLDTDLPQEVARLLHTCGVGADGLELEITEGVIMADPMRARAVLARLSAMGVRLAIDDFGSGYSSLGYLKQLPVDELKIDKSFVINMATDQNDAVIVRSTIDLGRNLGLALVAEGIETEEIWAELAALGCDVGQGFYVSRPIPAEELTSWLLQSRLDTAGEAAVGAGSGRGLVHFAGQA